MHSVVHSLKNVLNMLLFNTLSVLLHIFVITTINVFFFVEYLVEDGRKKGRNMWSFTTCLSIIVSNHCTVDLSNTFPARKGFKQVGT